MIYFSFGLAALCLILTVALVLKSRCDSSGVRLLSLRDIRNVLATLIDHANLACEHEGMQSTSLLLQKTLLVIAAGLQEEGAKALSHVVISFIEKKAEEVASTLDEVGETGRAAGRPLVPFVGDSALGYVTGYVPPSESLANTKSPRSSSSSIPWNVASESPVFRNGILTGFLCRSLDAYPAGFYLSRGNWTTILTDDQLALIDGFRSTSQPSHA